MILIGEYAVLEGADALVAAVDRRAVVTFNSHPDLNTILLSSPQMGIFELPCTRTRQSHIRFDPELDSQTCHKMNFIARLIESALTGLEVDPGKLCGGWSAGFDTDQFYVTGQPVKLGFGSSSAMAVALTAGLGKIFNTDLSTESIFRIALHIHHAAQGKSGSGIDVAACTYGGIQQYNLNRTRGELQGRVSPLSLPENLGLAVIYTGQSASTREMVSGFYELKAQNPGLFESTLQAMIECSGRAVEFFRSGQTDSFLNEVDTYFRLLERLSAGNTLPVISPVHQDLYRLARKHGCYYKPSGAGGGDIGTVFYKKEQNTGSLFDELTTRNFPPVPVGIAERGVIYHL